MTMTLIGQKKKTWICYISKDIMGKNGLCEGSNRFK
jgi:hypothetical protein